MNARMDASSFQAVFVQKVFFASPIVCAPRLPGARFACRQASSEYQKKPGRNRVERIRSRVTEISAMRCSLPSDIHADLRAEFIERADLAFRLSCNADFA